MRSLPMLIRLAEEAARMPRVATPFASHFFNSLFPPVWSATALPSSAARWQKAAVADWPPVKIDKKGFQVTLDVSEYEPNELTVKTVDNNLIIEGKSEDQLDPEGGFISRQFVRRFALPEGYEAEKAMSALSSDGVLTVSVPNPTEQAAAERVIPIQQTGQTLLNKENREAGAEKESSSAVKSDATTASKDSKNDN